MRRILPLAALAACLATTAVLANAPGAQATSPLGETLPMGDLVRLIEDKGYGVVEISAAKDAYDAVLKTADGRLVTVRVDPRTARLLPAEDGDLLRNILDQPK